MTLQEFLSLIEDEEARIELKIDDGPSDDYSYHHFWLSVFNTYNDIAFKCFGDYNVSSFSFVPEEEMDAQIRIFIKH